MAAHNPVNWFEIYVQDMPRAKRFYETMLGVSLTLLRAPEGELGEAGLEMWSFNMSPDGPGAGGALVKMPGVPSMPGGTMVYFWCEDCGIEEARIADAGGRVHRPKMSIGNYGFITLAFDSEGNMFGLHSMK
jgi:predicted enzyme related to lactoylglutathione lyase